MPAVTLKKVLMLSDNPRICQDATSALREDYSIFATRCKPERVGAALVQMRPDLVVCDRRLIRSVSAAAQLQAQVCQQSALSVDASTVPVERGVRPRLMILLGEGEERFILDCFEHGADDYIFTPILGHEMKAKVEALIGDVVDDAEPSEGDSGPAEVIPEDTEPTRIGQAPVAAAGPSVLGRYQLREIIGQGGYGVVYRAVDHRDGASVALKLLPREASEQPESVARFFRESSAIARLNHPNIVRFCEFDSFQGRYFFTMELVDGIDLKDLADRDAPFPVERAANYVAQVARGLSAINSIGFVHRDVKPENMILCHDGTLKLIDFGLVKIRDAATITCENDVLGTPYYMGPEYIAGDVVLDVRYDIYSLGVTFYVLLTGQYPFVGRNTAHVLEKHLREKPPHVRVVNPEVPMALDDLICRMLAKEPRDRPQSPAALIEELIAIFGEQRLALP
jgi:CheY-like chemotaxis protein